MVDLLLLKQALKRCSNDALLAIRAVIGGDVDVLVIQHAAELILKEQEVLGACAHDGVNFMAGGFELARNGEGNGQADAASDNRPVALTHFSGLAKRTGNVLDGVACLVGGQHFCGFTNYHKDEFDPTLFRIPVSKRERNTLAGLIGANHKELTSVCMLGHLRCFNAELKNLFRELRLFEDLIHSAVLLSRTGYPRAVDRGYARPAHHLNDHLGDGRKMRNRYCITCRVPMWREKLSHFAKDL